MKKLILAFTCSLFFSFSYGQGKNYAEEAKIKKAILSFLHWHKLDQIEDTTKKENSRKMHHPIIVRKQIDTMIKVSIDMAGVEEYLKHLKSSNVISDTFINDLRQYHQKIADEIELWKPFQVKDSEFAIPGLNCDVIFGCEPEAILDHIKDGKFTKVYQVYDKALVKFDVTAINQYVFVLTKLDNKWLIDYFGFDSTNVEKILKQR